MLGTPTDFSRLLARSWVVPALPAGIFLFVPVIVLRKATEKNAAVELERSSVLAMMIFAPRVFQTAAAAPDKDKGSWSMTVHVPETIANSQNPSASGRRQHGPDDHLILSELNPTAVVDCGAGDDEPLNLITFGNVREVCPKCKQHLKLVLRQARVRIAHLLCSGCESCFDAHYENGAPALTI